MKKRSITMVDTADKRNKVTIVTTSTITEQEQTQSIHEVPETEEQHHETQLEKIDEEKQKQPAAVIKRTTSTTTGATTTTTTNT
jgi:hypothetical protein